VTDTYKIVRIKRWASREDREQNLDWKSPFQLSPEEMADLSKLDGTSPPNYQVRLETMLMRGGDLIAAYSNSRIVGSLTFAFVPTLHGLHCLVSETRYSEVGNHSVLAALREGLHRVAEGRGTIKIHQLEYSRPAPRRSDISEIELVERLDRDDAHDDSDGSPTKRLPIVGSLGRKT